MSPLERDFDKIIEGIWDFGGVYLHHYYPSLLEVAREITNVSDDPHVTEAEIEAMWLLFRRLVFWGLRKRHEGHSDTLTKLAHARLAAHEEDRLLADAVTRLIRQRMEAGER